MADFNRNGDPVAPSGPWPSEAEIETERRLTNIERNLTKSNSLVMELQLEHRQSIRELKSDISQLATMMKDFLKQKG